MKLTKILLLIIVFEIIAFVYVINIDRNKYYDDIFEEASYDNKHKISFSEISHKDFKKIKVYYKKRRGVDLS